jgi:RNA polymerase sigma-70 factor (family 1)
MDAAEFEAMFREHYERLCRFAMTVVRSREDAEDVVQQAFVNLWSRRTVLEIRTSTRAYLYRAVRNGALNRVRESRNVVTLHAEPLRSPAADPPPDPLTSLDARESADRLHEAMAGLGPRCRDVLRLRWIEGMSHAEIGDALGITRKAVESNITRGLRALRDVLDAGSG